MASLREAGLTLTIVALVDSCLTVSKLVVTAKDFPIEAEALRLGLIGERARLTTWARAWKLPIYTESAISVKISQDANNSLEEEAEAGNLDLGEVQGILDNMYMLLTKGKAMEKRYQVSSTEKLDSLSKKFKISLSTAVTKVQWAVSDKGRLKAVISYLKEHNDRLERLRPRNEFTSKHSQDTAVACEVLTATDLSSAIDGLDINLPEEVLAEFPGLRAVQLIVDMRKRQRDTEGKIDTEGNIHKWTRYKSLEIEQWEYRVTWSHVAEDPKRILAWYATHEDKTGDSNSPANKNLAAERVERVAQLLSVSSKPPELHILDCLGYFQDDQKCRFGILYGLPTTTPETARAHYKSTVTTLSQLLGATDTNRLQKNFNSDNVIFFLPDGSTLPQTNIGAQYIASFGLSRPDHDVLLSEVLPIGPTSSALLEFTYHHPAYKYPGSSITQRGSTVSRFHRAFDVYSLGCVLLEIGLWKPLKSRGWRDVYQEDLGKWRDVLRRCTEKNLAFATETTYAEVVFKCLESDVVDPDTKRESERVREFCWEIVQALERLRV